MSYRRVTAEDLIDRAEITDLSYAYATGIDRCDWTLYRSIFADQVRFDFSSWSGAPAETLPADAWVARVRDTLSLFDATQHVMTNHRVALDGNRARATNAMSAHHHFVGDAGRQMHAIGGFYTNDFERTADGWRVTACALTVTWEMGDRGLFAQAAARGMRRGGPA